MVLPVLDSCDDCGACCRNFVGTPFEKSDIERLPEELKDGVRQEISRSVNNDEPRDCIWFNTTTKKCNHHEHRPRVCRDFKVGDAPCINARTLFGVRG